MEQRGFYEPAERDRTGSELRPEGVTARLSAWSRIAAARAAGHGDLVPAQRECTSAS
jgi:hypothetical protein